MRLRIDASSMVKLLLQSLLLIPFVLFAQVDDPYPTRFGHALFNPEYIDSPLDIGSIYYLSPIQLATLNIENCADLMGANPELYHPDLVTAGRSVYISSVCSGPRGTRVFWQGRPFRDIRTGRSDLSLLPPVYIGGLRSVHWGVLNGAVAPGSVIDLQPLEPQTKLPVTFLTHRDGFYDFGPVEFVHTRQVGERSFITAGGLIPSSRGRFAHAGYKGHILYGQYQAGLGADDNLTIAYMSNLNRHDIPFSEMSNKIRRGDLDAVYRHRFGDNASLEMSAYRAESAVKLDKLNDYGREFGGSLRMSRNNMGLYLRLNRVDGWLPGNTNYRLNEFEGTIGGKYKLGPIRLQLLGGGYGWLPNRIKVVAAAAVDVNIYPLGELFANVKQAVDPHSPEMMYAEYRGIRPWDEFEPAWYDSLTLPVLGSDKPPTIRQDGIAGIRRKIGFSEVEVAGFASIDRNPVLWSIKHDSTIALANLARRYSYGMKASLRFDREPYRAKISFVGTNLREESSVIMPVLYREPGFKSLWEISWHRNFWDNDFETDISLGGKYFGSFDAYGPNGWEKIGNAYPLDLRLTFRIRRMTLYYGVHNWNSYQYYLMPNYKMMHKEEYWGVSWLLID